MSAVLVAVGVGMADQGRLIVVLRDLSVSSFAGAKPAPVLRGKITHVEIGI